MGYAHIVLVPARASMRWIAVVVLGVAGIAACSSTTEPPTEPPTGWHVTAAGGDGQHGSSWAELPEPLRVQVTDAFGDPIEGEPVTFTVAVGHGSLEGAAVITDASGIAESGTWTLGDLAGEQLVRAKSGPVQVFLSAYADPPGVAGLNGQLAFVSNRDGNPEIYSMSGDGSDLQRLTVNEWTDTSPAWSPDGTQIAFASDRDSQFGTFAIYTMTADGSDVTRRIELWGRAPAWSPDGSTLAYSTLPEPEIAIVNVADPTTTLLTRAPGSGSNDQPSWSPDGFTLAFVSDRRSEDLGADVFTMQADGTDPVFRLSGEHPAWSPDGGLIAFLHGSSIGLMAAEGVFLRDLAWVGDRAVFVSDNSYGSFAWSPDGLGIAYTFVDCDRNGPDGCEEDAVRSVNYVSLDGSEHGRIVWDAYYPTWQP